MSITNTFVFSVHLFGLLFNSLFPFLMGHHLQTYGAASADQALDSRILEFRLTLSSQLPTVTNLQNPKRIPICLGILDAHWGTGPRHLFALMI